MRVVDLRCPAPAQNSSWVVWFIKSKERVNLPEKYRAPLSSNRALICNWMYGLFTSPKPDAGFWERPSGPVAVRVQPYGGGGQECRGATGSRSGSDLENYRRHRDTGASGEHHGCQWSSECHVSGYRCSGRRVVLCFDGDCYFRLRDREFRGHHFGIATPERGCATVSSACVAASKQPQCERPLRWHHRGRSSGSCNCAIRAPDWLSGPERQCPNREQSGPDQCLAGGVQWTGWRGVRKTTSELQS